MTDDTSCLNFGNDDLVYGPSANSELSDWREKMGGKLLNEVADPYNDGFTDWLSRSKYHLEVCISNGNYVHFDLTYMEDIPNILIGIGRFADKITSDELRYIKKHWERMRNNVKFYKNNVEVDKPW